MLRLIVFCVCFVSFGEFFQISQISRSKRQSNVALNDTQENLIIEIFNDCKCVLHYTCDKSGFIITDGKGLFDERIGENDTILPLCHGGKFDGQYICCKLRNNATENPVNENVTVTTEMTSYPIFSSKKPYIPKCGMQRPAIDIRIFNDESELTPVEGEFPWLAAIFRKTSGSWKFLSGGSLIHPRVILTVTHYFLSAQTSELKVLLNGKIELSGITNNTMSERNVAEIIKHPEYNSGALYNDIALLILDEPYDLLNKKHYINKICILPNITYENKKCLVAGWGKIERGKTNILKKVQLPTVSHSQCQSLLRKTRLGSSFKLHESFMCAGGEKGKDACKGDGGSPLMCPTDNGNIMHQVGIVSWGIGCSDKNVPGVYADVAFLYNWVVEELKKRDIVL